MSTLAAAEWMRLSTDELPERDRFPFWCEVFGRLITRINFEPVVGREFRQAVSMRAFDGLGLLFGETNGVLGRRSGALLADGNDELVFTTNLSGFSLPSQRGRELELRTGEAVLVSCAEAGSQDFPEWGRFLTLRI